MRFRYLRCLLRACPEIPGISASLITGIDAYIGFVPSANHTVMVNMTAIINLIMPQHAWSIAICKGIDPLPIISIGRIGK